MSHEGLTTVNSHINWIAKEIKIKLKPPYSSISVKNVIANHEKVSLPPKRNNWKINKPKISVSSYMDVSFNIFEVISL